MLEAISDAVSALPKLAMIGLVILLLLGALRDYYHTDNKSYLSICANCECILSEQDYRCLPSPLPCGHSACADCHAQLQACSLKTDGPDVGCAACVRDRERPFNSHNLPGSHVLVSALDCGDMLYEAVCHASSSTLILTRALFRWARNNLNALQSS